VSVTPFYANWARYAELASRAMRSMPDDEVGLRAEGGDHWPIWAIGAHVAGARAYWLCMILGEPGIETTSFFIDATTQEGWEDDLSKPRTGAAVADALDVSWAIVAGCLERWTPEMLSEAMRVETPRGVVHHTRQSILLRLITHDAYHAGEIALIQGSHGRPQLDLWPPGAHTVEGMAR
jgi:uncharacterized damage-inducible protein DinB